MTDVKKYLFNMYNIDCNCNNKNEIALKSKFAKCPDKFKIMISQRYSLSSSSGTYTSKRHSLWDSREGKSNGKLFTAYSYLRAKPRKNARMLKVLAIYIVRALIVYANPYLNSVKNTPCIRTRSSTSFKRTYPLLFSRGNRKKQEKREKIRGREYIG